MAWLAALAVWISGVAASGTFAPPPPPPTPAPTPFLQTIWTTARHALDWHRRGTRAPLQSVLLENGADANFHAPDASTPLILAALWADAAMVRLLLAHRPDPALRDSDGRTALDFTIARCDVEMQEILGGCGKEAGHDGP